MISRNTQNIGFWIYEAKNPIIKQSRANPDGWGVGYVCEDRMLIEKDINPAYKDKKFKNFFKELQSDIVILNIRKSSVGSISLENTSPFKEGKWVFTHNGTITAHTKIEPLIDMNTVKGETDSEKYFHLLLKYIKEKNNIVQGVEETVNKIFELGDYTSLNFLVTDGEKIYALCEYKMNDKYYVLHYLNKPEFVIIASEPLTKDDWQPLQNHELMVVDRYGEIEKILIGR
ncbi:MAG: class II glutamine amidotransferase [Thermoplasmatales archaeon]|nr:class II glutamine amidotransferase [Thermoplasmatales archaeon]